jgi:hypothetical protein
VPGWETGKKKKQAVADVTNDDDSGVHFGGLISENEDDSKERAALDKKKEKSKKSQADIKVSLRHSVMLCYLALARHQGQSHSSCPSRSICYPKGHAWQQVGQMEACQHRQR